jgi:uncharacterized membrane protein YeaQ/YmgE (transglycosylase-associated protein family)
MFGNELEALIPGTFFNPAVFLTWLLVGLIAGFLANVAMRGGSYELVSNIITGIIGACIGGFLAGLLGLGYFSFVGSVVLAFIGACVLIAILHSVAESTGRAIL